MLIRQAKLWISLAKTTADRFGKQKFALLTEAIANIYHDIRHVGQKWAIGKMAHEMNRSSIESTFLFTSSEEVPELTNDNFYRYIKTHKRVFVMFYDPFCPICRRASIDFEKLYNELKTVLVFGALDGTEHQEVAQNEGIMAFPTFKLYDCIGRCGPVKSHEGGLSLDELKAFVKFIALEQTFDKFTPWLHGITQNYRISTPLTSSLSIKRISTSACAQSIPELPKMIKIGRNQMVMSQGVMEVNGNNFLSKLKTFDSALVFFYATWCSHCSSSLNEFMRASNEIDDTVGVFAICNVEESLEIVDKYYVSKLPTLKYFRKSRYITDYIGEVKTDVLVKFMKDPHIDEDFILKVTKHKPRGDLHEGDILTPTRKKKLWKGRDGSEMILEITTENIDKILKENSSLLLLFYACWNRICVGLKHDYINVAKAVENTDVVLGACDCEEHPEVADKFEVCRFPAIKYFRNGKLIRDYTGPYNLSSMIKFLNDPSKLQITPIQQVESDGVHSIPSYWKGVEGGTAVVHFTDLNYRDLLKTHNSIFIMFYVSWCTACTPMKRILGQAALRLNKDVGIFGACNAENNNEMADKFFVIKLPTMKYFKNGVYVTDYTGSRSVDQLLSFMKNPPSPGEHSKIRKT